MYKVKIENACSCFIKSGMAEVLDFATEDEAEKEAIKILDKMKNNFCNRHTFSMNEKFGDFTIYVKS